MTWTRDVPTKPGWYWWRRIQGDRWATQPGRYHVTRRGGVLVVGTIPVDHAWFHAGEWSDGPLEEPEEGRAT